MNDPGRSEDIGPIRFTQLFNNECSSVGYYVCVFVVSLLISSDFRFAEYVSAALH